MSFSLSYRAAFLIATDSFVPQEGKSVFIGITVMGRETRPFNGGGLLG